MSGSHNDTWSDDGVVQTIQERQSGGRKSGRYGYLEHKWIFQVQPGDSITLIAKVTADTADDSFTFAYSTDDAGYIGMFAVNSASSGSQTFTLPPTLNGTVYIRVRDNVRQAGTTTSHAVQVDQLLIQSGNGSEVSGNPSEPPATLLELSANGYKVKGRQHVDLTWSGAQSGTVDLYRDGSLVADSAANDGSFTDNIGRKGGGSYTYEICEAGSTNCSNTASVIF